MKQYTITGMSCAACSARVEKAVSKVPGITACSVSLLTNSMAVEGTAAEESIIAAVKGAGYGIEPNVRIQKTAPDPLTDHEIPALKRRLIASLFFLIILMYLSMGHMMWGWRLPACFADNPVALGLAQLLLTTAVMVINQSFFVRGIKGLLHRAPNMDTLVALGAGAAFAYSTYALFAMTNAQTAGDLNAVTEYAHAFYFESAAMILALITVGKMLEARSKGKTTNALKKLMQLKPKTAVLLKNDVETIVPIEQIQKGDIFIVRPGECIPTDGVVLEGNSVVNEAVLTGESMPIDKASGDAVSAATINQSGFIRCRATNVGEDTTLAQIIRLVNDAAATKAPIAKAADKISGIFVPTVLAIAAVTFLIWMLLDYGFGFALARSISVLVISCPCALGLATPVAIMVGNGIGAQNGILFKTATALEQAGQVKTVILDKTGTITTGEPVVTDLFPMDGITNAKLLQTACALERKSEHPLAGAILKKAEEMALPTVEVSSFRALPGNGLTGIHNGVQLAGGNQSFIGGKTAIPPEAAECAKRLSKDGKTPLFFSEDDKLIGIIAVADTIHTNSPQAIQTLRNMGLYVVMLTGDNKQTALAIGKQAGVDEVIADVLPADKARAVRQFKKRGKVAMVGDGINDAPALTCADVGIAIGAGTDIAIDAADVVLVKSDLTAVPAAVRLSRATRRNIYENLFWAFIYNVVGIPLAAGVWIPMFHWELNPMFGAAAMSLSSFCVVANALRLNFVDIHHGKRTVKQRKEQCKMKKTLTIEGMMCGHCEANVKKHLEALPQVLQAEVSHERGTAVVTLQAEIADELLQQAVEAQGYTVKAITA